MRNFAYQVKEMLYDGTSLRDELNFYHQNHGEISKLTTKLTYIMGDYNKNYPISMMTMGNLASPSATVELADVQFTYPVMGRDTKASACAGTSYVSTDTPGKGFQQFDLVMQDNLLKRFYIIESARGIQAQILEDPTQQGEYWLYKCQLDPADEDTYCPLSELQNGVLWAPLYAAVAESESRGTRSNMAAPGLYKNQMGFMRTSMEWAGNAANKVMSVTVKTDKGETNGWMDYAMWQFEKQYLEDCETMYWYSRYNRLANSAVPLKDMLTGKIIPRGSGLIEQIQNKSTFGKLTYSGMANKIGDALFGQSDTQNMSITLHTGLGGLQDFDEAMKEKGKTLLTDFTGVANQFVEGSSKELMLTGFFKGFYHVDGYIIKVKHNPIMDMGKVARKSPLHPRTGYPLESHRLIFIDDNDYDGQPNIQHVAQKGRSFIHGIVQGMTPVPRSLGLMNKSLSVGTDDLKILSSETDKSSYHRFKSAGIQALRTTKCFDMQCVMGL